jgi:hypothetical protein
MTHRSRLLVLLPLVLLLVALPLACGGCGGGRVGKEFRPTEPVTEWSNDKWATVLDEVATEDGFVRWQRIKDNTNGVRDTLYEYVGLLNAASPESDPQLFPTDNDKLAYYVNAYNALCMYGIVERGYPGNVLRPGYIDPGALFFLDRFYIGGERTTLDSLEQGTLDKTGRDPRLHFAFNCMSYSCPPLRAEPFEGDVFAAQLRDQGERYLSDPRAAVRDDEDTVKLNSIFTSFYRGDFTRGVEGEGDMKLINGLLRFAADDSPIVGATDWDGMGYKWELNSPPEE